MFTRRSIALVAMLAVLALGVAGASQRVRAQQPESVQPGSAAIWTDKQQYTIGESIQYCYRIPIAGLVTITDLPADGSSNLIFNQVVNTTQACQTGTVTPPAGQECLRLGYPLAGGRGQTQTCFLVVGGTPPAPPSGLTISTNRQAYNVGDSIQICYRVPAPGPFSILDILANGMQQTISSGYDDGTGGCFPGTVTPPAGTECLRITFNNVATAQTCFRVNGPLPPPPGGWTPVGSAQVDGNGNWHFGGQVGVNTSLTYMRVTSANCDSDPASVLVWEGNLVRDNAGRIGVDVFDGDLTAIGLAVSSGGSGHARLTRPVTLNPPTQIDATLWSVGIIYTGTNLTVCLRAP